MLRSPTQNDTADEGAGGAAHLNGRVTILSPRRRSHRKKVNMKQYEGSKSGCFDFQRKRIGRTKVESESMTRGGGKDKVTARKSDVDENGTGGTETLKGAPTGLFAISEEPPTSPPTLRGGPNPSCFKRSEGSIDTAQESDDSPVASPSSSPSSIGRPHPADDAAVAPVAWRVPPLPASPPTLVKDSRVHLKNDETAEVEAGEPASKWARKDSPSSPAATLSFCLSPRVGFPDSSFTLTTPVESESHSHQPPTTHIQRRTDPHYLQSPHWMGQVRVNPFSPCPAVFLQPPNSVGKFPPCYDRNRGSPGDYSAFSIEPPRLPTSLRRSIGSVAPCHSLKPTRSRRTTSRPVLHPILPRATKKDEVDEDFHERISPTNVALAKFPCVEDGGSAEESPPPTASNNKKRKAVDIEIGRPGQTATATSPLSLHFSRSDNFTWPYRSDIVATTERAARPSPGSRYLQDFEEVRFLGSGSFGSVNACLSRLDGCTYAVKSIRPGGAQDGAAAAVRGGGGYPGIGAGRSSSAAGGYAMRHPSLPPPTPRKDFVHSPVKRKRSLGRIDDNDDERGRGGSRHWNDVALRRMLQEVFALAALCNQADIRTFHIVRYHQAWLEDDGTLYIQTELCSATLRDQMSKKLPSKNPENAGEVCSLVAIHEDYRRFKILREVLFALELVHQRGMVHLDIKPENIFVKKDLYKLGDFGLVHEFTKNEGAVKGQPTTDVEEGDSRYMPRDLLADDHRDLTKCDIFSLGVTMYEVCLGRSLPACGDEWQDLRNGNLLPLPDASPLLHRIIKEMMHPDPASRPSATNLLARKELAEKRAPLIDSLHSASVYPPKSRLKRSASL